MTWLFNLKPIIISHKLVSSLGVCNVGETQADLAFFGLKALQVG